MKGQKLLLNVSVRTALTAQQEKYFSLLFDIAELAHELDDIENTFNAYENLYISFIKNPERFFPVYGRPKVVSVFLNYGRLGMIKGIRNNNNELVMASKEAWHKGMEIMISDPQFSKRKAIKKLSNCFEISFQRMWESESAKIEFLNTLENWAQNGRIGEYYYSPELKLSTLVSNFLKRLFSSKQMPIVTPVLNDNSTSHQN